MRVGSAEQVWDKREDGGAVTVAATQLHGRALIPSFPTLPWFGPLLGAVGDARVPPCRGEGGRAPAPVGVAAAGAPEGIPPQPGEHRQGAPQGEGTWQPRPWACHCLGAGWHPGSRTLRFLLEMGSEFAPCHRAVLGAQGSGCLPIPGALTQLSPLSRHSWLPSALPW